MGSESFKSKILKFMMADSGNTPKAINDLILLAAKDYTDVYDLKYFLIIYDALCRLESEGKVVDVSDSYSPERSKLEAIRESRWKLKK